MKEENRWNTKMEEAPENSEVLVCYSDGSQAVTYANSASTTAIAWKLLPEPYKPRKPEQLTREDVVGRSTDGIITLVEKRTREIVAWEQEHGE